MSGRTPAVGFVVIGRNEGHRLNLALDRIGQLFRGLPAVYVDSGSTDGSVVNAESRGWTVVRLDPALPFTAARARREGLERLVQLAPDVAYAFFMDGDCELVAGWMERAIAELDSDDKLAAVCGRRRERYPKASVYNWMIDLEWDTVVGLAKSCGGDAMYRVAAVLRVGNFDPTMIAGEEPELCYRLRKDGWLIGRIDQDMTIHDAALSRASQWWRRCERGGHAFAEGYWKHRAEAETSNFKKIMSIVGWVAAWPVAISVVTLGTLLLPVDPRWAGLVAVLGFVAYPAQAIRLAWRARKRCRPFTALAWGCWMVVGKFAEFVGVCRYFAGQLTDRPSKIIEYKSAVKSEAC